MRDRGAAAAFLAIVLLAGGSGVAVRFSNHELAPFWGATVRLIIATTVLFTIVALVRLPLPRGRALVGSVLYGLLGFAAPFGLLYRALVDAGAGLAQIILALVPLLTFLLAVGIGLERFRWQSLAGATVALGGIAIVFAEQVRADVPVLALLAIVAASACMAGSNVVVKRFPRANPVSTNAVAMAAGGVVLAAATLVSGDPMVLPGEAQTWVAIGYVSVLGSVAVFSLFVYVIARWSASAASYVMLLIPLVTVVLAAVLDHEPVTPGYLVGGPMVLAGVYVGAFAPPLGRLAQRLPTVRPPVQGLPVVAVTEDTAMADDGIGNPGCA